MKTCPRCYNKIQDDLQYCPNCKFRVLHLEAAKVQNSSPRTSKSKKKLKKSEFIFMIGIFSAFALFLIFSVVIQNGGVSFPSSSRGAKSAPAMHAELGNSGGGTANHAAAEENTKEQTQAAFEIGEERTVHGDSIYFAARKENLQAALENADQADALAGENKLYLLSEGDIVAIIEAGDDIAFVDVLTGDYENTTGYVLIRNL